MGNSSGIHNTILDVIGQTPIVKLHRLSRDLRCEVYAKLENLNPGGSHKVRIALAMIQDAEKRGVLRRGSGVKSFLSLAEGIQGSAWPWLGHFMATG